MHTNMTEFREGGENPVGKPQEVIEAKGGSTLNFFISTLIHRSLEKRESVIGRFNGIEFTFEYHDKLEDIDNMIKRIKELFGDSSPYESKYGGI